LWAAEAHAEKANLESKKRRGNEPQQKKKAKKKDNIE